jgi:hypothetical protein
LVQGDPNQQAVARPPSAVGETHRQQRIAFAFQGGDGSFVDGHAGGGQPFTVGGVEIGGSVGEQGDVVASDAQQQQQQGAVDAKRARVENPEGLVAGFPAVAEQAVEHRPPHSGSMPGISG